MQPSWNWSNLNYLEKSCFGYSTYPHVAGNNHSGRFIEDSFLYSGVHLLDF
jgi:hypothetical protein